jgi:hypothetical protein
LRSLLQTVRKIITGSLNLSLTGGCAGCLRFSTRFEGADDADALQDSSKIQFYHALVLLVRARRIGRNVGGGIACFDEFVLDEITFDFFATDVGKHAAIDLDTRRKRLPTFRFHFPAKGRVLNDVFLGVGQIVFGKNRADTGAPATIGL